MEPRKILLAGMLIGVAFLTGASLAHADRPIVSATDTIPDIHIARDGSVTAQGAKVMQIANTTIFVRFQWDRTAFPMTVKTDEKTKFYRRHGGTTSVKDIQIGDYITFDATIEAGSDTLVVAARKVTDLSIQTVDEASYKGTVAEVNVSGEKFKLTTPSKEIITVEMMPDIKITKGTRRFSRFDLQSGAQITSVVGTFDRGSNTLRATEMVIFLEMTQFSPRNFQGVIKSIEGATLPTTMVVTVKDRDYTVKLGEKVEILNNKRKAASLKRFVAGDTVRFYGNTTEENPSTVENVEVLRNLDL